MAKSVVSAELGGGKSVSFFPHIAKASLLADMPQVMHAKQFHVSPNTLGISYMGNSGCTKTLPIYISDPPRHYYCCPHLLGQ
jgi:hypothetical protein